MKLQRSNKPSLRPMLRSLGGAIGLCLLLVPMAMGQTPATPTAPSFSVSGAIGKPGAWTVAKLRQEFASDIQTVDYTLKGNKGQAHCISLLSFLKAAQPTLNPKAKNHLLSFVALVRAEDGYTISFSMGELQPDIGKREVWIALDRNGQPIPGDDGPVELMVTTDERPARWVHGVSRIVVIDGIHASEAPENAPKKAETKP